MMANDGKRQITAQEATIKTASIEVKTLTLGNKQMTLAVFRQLPLREIIDLRTGGIQGTPWGQVNYHSGNCLSTHPHIHVVWQEGSRLYQSCDYEGDSRPQQFIYGRSIRGKVGQHFDSLPLEEQVEFAMSYSESYQQLEALDQLFIAV